VKIQNPRHLVIEEINSIEPIGYSILFENEEHKTYWVVSLTGNSQAFLADSNSKLIQFESMEKADMYCKNTWPNLPLI
jgi:hypothetical protein